MNIINPSLAAHVWRKLFSKPFIVRGTVGNIKNEIVSSHATYGEAISNAGNIRDSSITNALQGKIVWRKNKP